MNDDRLSQAHQISMREMCDRLAIERLVRVGDELIGPCPVCGGRDRFSINLTKNVFFCRRCEARGDQVALVQHVMGVSFPDALKWLCGDPVSVDSAELERRRRKREQEDRRQADVAARKRDRAISAARAIWGRTAPGIHSPAQEYLERRGIDLRRVGAWPAALRYSAEEKYTVWRSDRRAWSTVHVGPAMVAAIVDASGEVVGVHRTWFDLSAPDGKAVICDGGDVLPRKKTLGSKKGNVIRLLRGGVAPKALIMGEGIETTLSVACAAPVAGAAYWCGIDLGNMGGAASRPKGPHPSDRAAAKEWPDLDDKSAFVPPDWADRLIYLQDGDSAPGPTRAKLLRGLRRAIHFRPNLRAQIVHAGDGVDFNDLISTKKGCAND